jgi:hypothetical protein
MAAWEYMISAFLVCEMSISVFVLLAKVKNVPVCSFGKYINILCCEPRAGRMCGAYIVIWRCYYSCKYVLLNERCEFCLWPAWRRCASLPTCTTLALSSSSFWTVRNYNFLLTLWRLDNATGNSKSKVVMN